ncbi:TPA_asm: hypothetical protein HUJ06_032058 [Nelumbo nucifera]|uniref:15.4 kDa class V heat shock protein-like n=2 Tax=Nelumbo nucifera TaxID=4432 RepID=A0A1U8BNN2_NELNU|nr:PREDICTED: 15.4 kDa class V heat shock protein-like [Nelumbo nucifera]DAD49750.1 TPA_asm: hypothetical protein HUJ06_032058 [Nelumbo nucifera]
MRKQICFPSLLPTLKKTKPITKKLEKSEMEFQAFQPSPWPFFFTSPFLFPSYIIPENYVHWTETPEFHIYTADLPGVRKEEIRVEVEDSRYLIIRTQGIVEVTEPSRSFTRKFRLPALVDVDRISAGYEDGVLRVTVPRRGRFRIDPAHLPERREILAPAA